MALAFAFLLNTWVTQAELKRPQPAEAMTVIKNVRQLFIDDTGIERMDGLRRSVNQPLRHPGNPVVFGEYPWEKANVSVYGTAMYDPDKKRFRLWYLCSPGPPVTGCPWVEVGGYRRVTNCTLAAYAESPDGVRWQKPVLNQLSFQRSTANNLLDIGIDNPEGISILHDPAEPDAARRYKAFFWDRRVGPPDDAVNAESKRSPVPKDPPGLTQEQLQGGMWVAFSPDGMHWKTHGPVLRRGSDTTQTILYDPVLKKYVGFGRFGFGRTVARTESADCLHWTEPTQVLAADQQDGPGAQIYGMPADLYEGIYLGMLWMYREGTDGHIDTQLASSRDGASWHRVAGRQTFLPNSPEGSRDDGMSRIVGRFITRKNTLYLYYSMVNGPHRGPKFPNPVRKFAPAIGLVTLRRDGFVSLDATEKEGSLWTKPFVMPGGGLRLNIDAGKGAAWVAVCDRDGNPFHGFERSRAVEGDSSEAAVQWPGAQLGQLQGKTLRLKISLRKAKLFSYWFD
jgi:hypothetical protein